MTTISVAEQEDKYSFLSKVYLTSITQYDSDATQYVKLVLHSSMGQ